MDEHVVQQQEVATQESESPKSSAYETNLNAMRLKLEESERLRRELEQRSQRYQNPDPTNPGPSPAHASAEEDDLAVDNDEYVQAKHIRLSNKKLNNKISEYKQETSSLKEKVAYLEAKFVENSSKDFNQIVSDENVRTLSRLYPDEYEAVMAHPNLATRAKIAYNMIRRYGIADDNNELARNEERFNANRQKPQSASVVAPKIPQTPLSQLSDDGRRYMSEADRDRILAEVERKKMLG